MFELGFKTFMEQVDIYTNQRNDRYRKIHYEEIEDSIILYLKSQELWEYFTIVPKSKMLAMYAGAGITEQIAVRMFKTNILYDAIPIKKEEVEVDNLPERFSDEEGNIEYDPTIVSKRVIAIGPRGGRIVAYGSNGKPIYEGSPEDRARSKPTKESKLKEKTHQIEKLAQRFTEETGYGSCFIHSTAIHAKIGGTIVMGLYDEMPHFWVEKDGRIYDYNMFDDKAVFIDISKDERWFVSGSYDS